MDRVLVPSEDEVSLPSQTLLELVLEENEASGEFQTLIDLLLVEAADAEQVEGRTALTTLLDDSRAGPFTVFLPTDAAFRGFSSASTSIVNDPLNVEARRSFLEFHVLLHAAGEELSPILATQYCDRLAVAGEYTTLDRGLKLRSDLTAGDTIILQGLFNEDDAAVQNCVRGELDVFVGDIAATNGVAHTTNIALVPEDGLNFESPVSDSSGLSTGAIVGIVIGSLAGAALIGGGGKYWVEKNRGDAARPARKSRKTEFSKFDDAIPDM